MNWRKHCINLALRASGSKLPAYYAYLRSIEFASAEKIRSIQEKKLAELLLHASLECPYYTKILGETGVIQSGEVHLEHFQSLPYLTKDIIRKEFSNIRSKKKVAKKTMRDTSGGSTGVPVEFLKDNDFWDFGMAASLLIMHMAGKEIGEKEVKLWGSERDTLEGKETLTFRAKNWLYNRILLNSFRMDEDKMRDYVKKINSFQPKAIWTYTESIYELARFVQKEKLPIFSPNAIVSTAGTVTPEIRAKVKEVFACPFINQYGSREVGAIASECIEEKGLHIFEFSQYLELLDSHGQAAASGNIGEIIITNLNNFSFPLIRYQIGDTAIASNEKCSCGRNLRLLQNVTGRVSDHFFTADGTRIHGEYFTHLFYHQTWVKKFQVHQTKYTHVDVRIIKENDPSPQQLSDIENKIKHVLGPECKVQFHFVSDIPSTSSGKYRYTISDLGN